MVKQSLHLPRQLSENESDNEISGDNEAEYLYITNDNDNNWFQQDRSHHTVLMAAIYQLFDNNIISRNNYNPPRLLNSTACDFFL